MDKQILIVEDEPLAALSLKEMLLKRGYGVVAVVSSGEEAIWRAEDLMPHLILMDIFLEGKLGGIAAARTIYNKLNIPIIFLTSYSQEPLIKAATQTEPFAYLVKPCNEAELYANIEISLLKHRSTTYLKELNATRDKFFSVVAHDLRNPLAALFQTTSILKDRMPTISAEDMKFFVEEINQTARNLYRLTENLLEWARLQNNKVECKPIRINLVDSVAHVIDILAISARNKSIKLINQVADKQYVCADTDMLLSILNNLLTNAIKFSYPNGEVIVVAKEAEGYVEVAVSDKGVGIEEKFISQLFSNAYKSAGTLDEKGTGLGLVLTREFVEKNGGRIFVSSKVGEGTSFTFTLPKE